jgi:hypothetical protein
MKRRSAGVKADSVAAEGDGPLKAGELRALRGGFLRPCPENQAGAWAWAREVLGAQAAALAIISPVLVVVQSKMDGV